jgi:hypothetical protein
MSEPIIEQIAAALATSLTGITRANGYGLDVAEVKRPTRGQPVTPKHNQIVMTQGQREPGQAPLNHDQWIQPFTLFCIVRPDDRDPVPADTYVNRLEAAVQKRLKDDQATWAAIVIDWDIAGPDPLPEDLGLDGVALTVNVTYRTLAGDPYQQ